MATTSKRKMATTSKKVTITLSHYTTYYDPKRPNLPLERVFKENPLRWSGTIIYGQIEGVPRSNPGVSDFRIAIVDDLEGRHGGGIQTQIYGEDVLRLLGVKTAILKEAKRRIALFRKAVKAGKKPSAREKFTVMATRR